MKILFETMTRPYRHDARRKIDAVFALIDLIVIEGLDPGQAPDYWNVVQMDFDRATPDS